MELAMLVDRFGREEVMVELIDHQLPEDSMRNEVLAEIAAALGLVGHGGDQRGALCHPQTGLAGRGDGRRAGAPVAE